MGMNLVELFLINNSQTSPLTSLSKGLSVWATCALIPAFISFSTIGPSVKDKTTGLNISLFKFGSKSKTSDSPSPIFP